MQKTIVIEGAIDSELHVLYDMFKPTRDIDLGGIWRAHMAPCAGGQVALLTTGVGVANAAAATALACAALRPAAVISQGTAGAHDRALHTGDIVIGTRIVRLGAYRSPRRMSGIAPLTWQPLDECGSIGSGIPTVYSSDALLCDTARNVLSEWACGAPDHMRIADGTLGSGDVWNCEHDMIEYLHSEYGTSCEDMETYSAAQVCAHLNANFLALRIISNNELLGESYAPKTAEQLQHAVCCLVKKLLEEQKKA